jgi:hypothetical protein
MPPDGDAEQYFREPKGPVGDAWTIEGSPLPEGARYRAEDDICLMRNEKADWSLQRRARDQPSVPRNGHPDRQVATTEFTEFDGRDESCNDARDRKIIPENSLRECDVGLVPLGDCAVGVARAATPPGPSPTIPAAGPSTDGPNNRLHHNFPHSPLYLFLPRLFSTRGEGLDYLAALRCDYHDP